jgi:hypothetical protein
MIKELEKVKDNTLQTWKWTGSMSNFLSEASTHLQNIAKSPSDKGARSQYKSLRSAFRYASRSETRGVNRHYTKTKKALEKLKEILPKDLQTELESIERKFLRPNEAILIRDTSFYTGKTKDEVKALGVYLDMLKKDKATEKQVTDLIENLNFKIAEIVGGNSKPGLVPFIAGLKRLQAFISKLDKLSA